MTDIREEFIDRFHNLPGTTVKKKQQNLFKLFREKSPVLNHDELDLIAMNLKPVNHLEKIFFVDFLIYFKRFNELYENFKNGDDITVSKVAKQDWFYQNVSKNIDGESFVTVLLPTLSHSLKLKILKKLQVEENKADEIFDILQKRYGIFLATSFLPKCTSGKIREALLDHPIKFTSSQLKAIYKKDPNLIYVYVEERTKHCGDSLFLNNDPFLVYIAQKNPEMFTKLFKKYKFDTDLGRRTTKNYIKSQKESIINDIKPYLDIMKSAVAVRKLNKDIIQSVLFEYCLKKYTTYWEVLLKHYPKKHQFAIFEHAFNTIYHHKFGEDIDGISTDMLKFMTDPLEREKLAKLKIEKENRDEHLAYVTPEYCLKEFKNKVNYMTANKRAKCLEMAVECCVLNKDTDSLLKVLELASRRFKNDEKCIRGSIFYALGNSDFADKLSEQHWKFIIEVLSIGQVRNEWIFNESYLRVKHIQFLIENNHDIKDAIFNYNEWPHAIVTQKLEKSKVIKPLLEQLIEIGIPTPNLDYPADNGRFDCDLAQICKIFNKYNPEHIIPIYENSRILRSVKQYIETPEEMYYATNSLEGVEYLICRSTSSEELLQLKKSYFTVFKDVGKLSVVMWFLQHEPEMLTENLDNFLSNLFETRSLHLPSIWRFFKKCSYLDLDQKTIEFCKQRLQDESDEDRKKIVKAFSILEKPDSYLDFVKLHAGFITKGDSSEEKKKASHSVRFQLVNYMHFIRSPQKVLPVTLEFCRADYFNCALSPLYSCFYKLPENETKIYIKRLMETNALSVKKQGVHLSCVIYDTDSVYECLKKTTNISLMAALRYFVKNPSDKLWELIETTIGTLDKENVYLLKKAIDVTVPLKYRSKYAEMLWKKLDKFDNKEVKKSLLKTVDKETARNFNPQFAFGIVRSTIFKFDEANDFISKILIFLDHDEKYTLFASVLQDFKKSHWSQRDARRKLHEFIKSLFQNYIDGKESNNKFVTEIQTAFKSVFPNIEAFEEHVILSCLSFQDVETCIKSLIEMNNLVDEDYRDVAVKILADTVKNYVFTQIFKTDNEQWELCSSLRKMRKSVHDCLLILALLPKSDPSVKKTVLLYNGIVKELGEVEDEVVQLQFNLYLKSIL